jgi:hypothetical protein
MKYLAIKNWEKYQVTQHYKSAPWCKLYFNLLDDIDFIGLSATEQLTYLLMLMLRTRVGKNLPNDHLALTKMVGKSRPGQGTNTVLALSKLTTKGFLILTDQQNGYENSGATPDQRRVEKRRGEENSRRPRLLPPCKATKEPT